MEVIQVTSPSAKMVKIAGVDAIHHLAGWSTQWSTVDYVTHVNLFTLGR